jgi:hypothetical protein
MTIGALLVFFGTLETLAKKLLKTRDNFGDSMKFSRILLICFPFKMELTSNHFKNW